MAAPSSTHWGSTVGGYGRIGIYQKQTITDTTVTINIQVWFWSKYSVSDSANNFYFNRLYESGSATTNLGSRSISTSVSSGEGWSTSNQVKIYETSSSYGRSTSGLMVYWYAKLADVDRVGGTMYASVTSYVSPLEKYTISYDANGGNGAPSSQTASLGLSLTLSTAKPTRDGYTFLGWATSSQATTATHSPGGAYTFTAATTLYAVWQRATYTVTYDANGGSGAPSSQTKYYGLALTLSTVKPTRSGYTFLGWARSSTAASADYAPGQSYTGNTALTLYAIWEKVYKKPSIYNVRTARCNIDFTENDDGECAKITFDWITQSEVTNITVEVTSETAFPAVSEIEASGTSGSVAELFFMPIYVDWGLFLSETIELTITVTDAGGSATAVTTFSLSAFTMDFHAGGDGVTFGKPATLGKDDSLGGAGVVEFAFDGKFNEPVYGKALGMDRLPAIPENANLDDYIETGCYAVYSNAIAETITNIPVNRAGRLEVWSATGEGVRAEQWSYLRQRYIPYNRSNAVWEREVTRGEDNVWNYYAWWRSSLTPAASDKVYEKAVITAAMSANVTLGVVNTYTQVPFPNAAVATSERIYIDGNSVKIGKDISFVRVSGQLLVKCGTVSGNRHARIQKVSGSTTTSHAWDCITAAASSNTLFSFSPVIVPVKEGDTIKVVYYTGDAADQNVSGSAANGWQSYITVEEI